MKICNMRKWALAAGAVIVVTGAALAHSGATGVVKQRMDGMKEMSNATKALGAVKAGAIPFAPEVIRRAAGQLRKHGEEAHHLFPEGSLQDESEALPLIWTDRASFDRILDDLIAAADRLDQVAEDQDMALAVADDVATTCKTCHEKFREKKI